jgi:hypothetical protein
LAINRILLVIIATIFIAEILLLALAYAQDDSLKTEPVSTDLSRKIDELDNLLTASTTASLAGLSMAAASFLIRLPHGENEEYALHIQTARKRFIIAFVVLVACTATLFIFDFLEVVWGFSLPIVVLDAVFSYGLFGTSLVLLVIGAKEIYVSHVK